jgi:hypothetical protein
MYRHDDLPGVLAALVVIIYAVWLVAAIVGKHKGD